MASILDFFREETDRYICEIEEEDGEKCGQIIKKPGNI